jgi:hypothetical protein
VPPAAPRISESLVAALKRLDDPRRPIAETHRLLGSLAEQLGLPRPSYEQVRVVVHSLRAGRREIPVGDVLLRVALRGLPPSALQDLLAELLEPPPGKTL